MHCFVARVSGLVGDESTWYTERSTLIDNGVGGVLVVRVGKREEPVVSGMVVEEEQNLLQGC